MNRSYGASLDASPDFTELAKTAIETKSNERKAAMKAESLVARQGLASATEVNINEQDAKLAKDVYDIKKPAQRMAGLVGALGLGAGTLVATRNMKLDKEAADKRAADYDTRTEAILSAIRDSKVEAPQLSSNPEVPGAKIKPLPERRPKVTPDKKGGADNVSDLSDGTIGSGTYELSSLTDQEWSTLSRVVSGEQGGGDDKFGIVASILNRVTSKDFPNTIPAVASQNDGKGTYQYEAFTLGTDYADSNLTATLKSPEGQAKILKALKVLDGRTDFKGQTMLHNRSSKGNKDYDGDGKPDLDPMFDPTGNFFHYHWQ